jgi:hypothetical protein
LIINTEPQITIKRVLQTVKSSISISHHHDIITQMP